jgi:hypothetical protein
MFNRKGILCKLTHLRHAAVFCTLLLCWPYLTLAQDAGVLPTVTDPFGAIPDVKITATNSEAILAQTFVTSDSGQYEICELEIAQILTARWRGR